MSNFTFSKRLTGGQVEDTMKNPEFLTYYSQEELDACEEIYRIAEELAETAADIADRQNCCQRT